MKCQKFSANWRIISLAILSSWLQSHHVIWYKHLHIGCPRSAHYVFSKLDFGLCPMILMVIIIVDHGLKVHFDLRKIKNSSKRPIIRQNMRFWAVFPFGWFSATVRHGGDYPCSKANLMLDRLKTKRHSTLLSNIGQHFRLSNIDMKLLGLRFAC